MPLLFVYGTLKRGHRLHHHLKGAPCLGAAKTVAGFGLYRLDWYPAMVAEPESAGVHGEGFEVTPALLALLDEVEGVPNLYQRMEIEIAELEGVRVQKRCLTYLYQLPVAREERLPDGAW